MMDNFGTTPTDETAVRIARLTAVVENLADWDGDSAGVDYLIRSARKALGRPETTEEESSDQ